MDISQEDTAFLATLYAACDLFLMDDSLPARKSNLSGTTSSNMGTTLLATLARKGQLTTTSDKHKSQIQNSNERDILFNFRDNQFRQHFRMDAETFETLCSNLSPHILRDSQTRGRKPVPLDRKVLMCLRFLGAKGESVRNIAKQFQVCESSASVILDSIIKGLNKLKTVSIKWPAQSEVNDIVQGFYNISAFPNVLGIMATTHISILSPKDHPEVYVNRKKNHTMVLQTICDQNMKFIDCYTGWPGSVHDSVVLCESDIFHEIENNPANFFLKEDIHLLGAVAYPLRTWLMTPYLDETHLVSDQQEYNKRLSETRLVTQQAFNLLQGRWCRLQFVGMTRTALIPNVIMACCVLHNFCLDNEQEYNDFLEQQIVFDDGFPIPTNTYEDDENGKIKRDNISAYISAN
ncbi:protein ALP1-like [Argonauta hians]